MNRGTMPGLLRTGSIHFTYTPLFSEPVFRGMIHWPYSQELPNNELIKKMRYPDGWREETAD